MSRNKKVAKACQSNRDSSPNKRQDIDSETPLMTNCLTASIDLSSFNFLFNFERSSLFLKREQLPSFQHSALVLGCVQTLL